MEKNLLGRRCFVVGISLLFVGIGFFPSSDNFMSSKTVQGSVCDPPPPVEWNHTYPPPIGQSGGNCIQETPDGGYIITGYAGWGASYSFYLLKINEQGNEQWNRTFGSGYMEANWVEVTDDNGYIITGRYCRWIEEQGAWVEDIWVIKTDQYGYEEWNWTRMTLYNDWGTCIKQTSDGGFITTDIASGDAYNFSLLKLDANGDVLWETIYENRWGLSFLLTPDDDIILTGLGQHALLLMKTDENGTIEWEQEFFQDPWPGCRGNDVHMTSDGGYIIGGYTSTYSAPSDLLLLKTDENGVEQWHQTYGFSGTDWGTSVALFDNGDYVLGGTHLGSKGDNFWLLRTTPLGNIIWSQFYLPLDSARCFCVQQTSENGVIASGVINDTFCVVLKLSNHTGNQPPGPPTINGPHYGTVATMYTFSLGDVSDPEGDMLYGFWDWGDDTSDWLGPYETGQPGNASHSWSEPGNYTIHVKIRDINGAMSNWTTFWIEIVQQRTAGYMGTFTSINQTDDLFILQGRTFIVFPSLPFITNDRTIVLSKRNLGYLGTTIAFGVGGITVLP